MPWQSDPPPGSGSPKRCCNHHSSSDRKRTPLRRRYPTCRPPHRRADSKRPGSPQGLHPARRPMVGPRRCHYPPRCRQRGSRECNCCCWSKALPHHHQTALRIHSGRSSLPHVEHRWWRNKPRCATSRQKTHASHRLRYRGSRHRFRRHRSRSSVQCQSRSPHRLMPGSADEGDPRRQRRHRRCRAA